MRLYLAYGDKEANRAWRSGMEIVIRVRLFGMWVVTATEETHRLVDSTMLWSYAKFNFPEIGTCMYFTPRLTKQELVDVLKQAIPDLEVLDGAIEALVA